MSWVLYRKYRPKTIDEVLGQTPIISTLKAGLKKQALGHALLFVGPRGVGKTSLARIVAHLVNDTPYKLDETPFDIIEIDAASNGRIDEVRDLREKIKLLPLKLKYKVYIIDEAHMLTKEAFNALLKTLEEPPEHIIFILATTEIHKLPATIISRCQRFTFKSISDYDLKEHLKQIAKKEKIKIDDKALTVLSQHALGSLRDGLSLLEQLATLNQKIDLKLVEEILGLPSEKLLDALLSSLRKNDFQKVAENYQNLIAQGVDPILLTQSLTNQIRQDLLTQKDVKKQADDLKLLEDLLNIFNNPQPQASLEMVLFKHTI